jgi:hypothetical protein
MRAPSAAEDARQGQQLSSQIDRQAQAVSRQADSLDSRLPLTQKAAEGKSRQIDESARQMEAERPADAAEIKKSGELAKEELGEAAKARSKGDASAAEAREEKARAHFDSALDKAEAIEKLDSAIRDLKAEGAPSEIIKALKTPAIKAGAAKELTEYARAASDDLKKISPLDKSAAGAIYARGLMALKAGKKVEAGLHSELARAYPKAGPADKRKIDDASSATSKGRMSAADVMALMSSLRTGPSGAGIPPGKIRERILALQAKIKALSANPHLSSKLREISSLVGPALAYSAKAEEARKTGDDAKAAHYDRIASNHLLEAEDKIKALEAPGAAGLEKSSRPALEPEIPKSAEVPVAAPEVPKAGEKPREIPPALMNLLKMEFGGREAAFDSWLTASGGDPEEAISVLKDIYSGRIEDALKETKDLGRIEEGMTILATLEHPLVEDLEAARVFLSAPPGSEPAAPEKPEAAGAISSGTDSITASPAAIAKRTEADVESDISLALSDARAKAASIDEPDLPGKYAKALGSKGAEEYGKLREEVSRAVAFAEEGAALLKESASAPEAEKDAKSASGMLLIGLAGRMLDVSAAKKESVLAGSGREELDLAGGLYADIAMKAALGTAGADDLKRIPEADSALKTGVGKIAEEKLEKMTRAERGEIKKIEKRLAELRGKWGGTFGFDKVETDINAAATHLAKGDPVKARRARILAAITLEIHSERAEIFDMHKKLEAGASDSEKKSGLSKFRSSEMITTLDEAIAKAGRGDIKGALKDLAAVRGKRLSESAEQILENIISEKMGVVSTVEGLERFCLGESPKEATPARIMKSSKTGKEVKPPEKSKAYTDAMKLVLDPLAASLRDKKIEILKDAEEVAKKRERLKTEEGADIDKIEPVVSKHREDMKGYSAFLKGASFAIDMGARGAHYIAASTLMDKRGIYDDILASKAAEYLRLGIAAASSPHGIAKSIDDGKAVALPELRHTVKGDTHSPDRVIAVSASTMKADEALKKATAGVLAVGEGKSLGKWDTDLSRAAAETDTRLTIAATFGLGKDAKGDYKPLFMTPAERDYIGKLASASKTASGWFFEFTSMGSPLSYDDRVAGLTASGDLTREIEKKAGPLITEIADRGAVEIPDWKTENIKAKMEDEGARLGITATAAFSKMIASVTSATKDEVISSVAAGAAEFLAANAATFLTGGLAGPLYYTFKSATAIGEAEISGEYEKMEWDEKAWLWAGFGFSAFGALSSAAGGAISGARGVAAMERTLEIAGKAGAGADIVMNMKALNDAVGSGASGYEIGLIIFTSAAPHAMSAVPKARPPPGAPDLGPSLARRAASVALTGVLPTESSSPEVSARGDETVPAELPKIVKPPEAGPASAAEKAKAIVDRLEKRYAGSRMEESSSVAASGSEMPKTGGAEGPPGAPPPSGAPPSGRPPESSPPPPPRVPAPEEIVAAVKAKREYAEAAGALPPKAPFPVEAPEVPAMRAAKELEIVRALYEKKAAGTPLGSDEAKIVADIDALVGKGISKEAAMKHIADARVRPHGVPLSSGAVGAFIGAGADIHAAEVPVYKDGGLKAARADEAPRARLLEAIDTDAEGVETGSTARVYRAEVLIDGKPKEVAAKIYKKGTKEHFDYMIDEHNTFSDMAKNPALAEFTPGVYGMVNVDGNLGYAMDIVLGKAIELKTMTADEARKFVTEGTRGKIGRMLGALTDAGYAIGDLQFAVITEPCMINGKAKVPGDVVIWDVGGARKAGYTPETAKSAVETKLAGVVASADRIIIEGSGGFLETATPEERKALDTVARGTVGRKFGIPPESVKDPIKRFLLLGAKERGEYALKFIEPLPSGDSIRKTLEGIEEKTGVRMIGGKSVAPSAEMPPAPSTEPSGPRASPKLDDPSEGPKNLALFARKVLLKDPEAISVLEKFSPDAKRAFDALCADTGFETFAKHMSEAEFEKNWGRVRSRKNAVAKALEEILKAEK